MDQEKINRIVKEVLWETMQPGYWEQVERKWIEDMGKRLYYFYSDQDVRDEALKRSMHAIMNDYYFNIIEMRYRDLLTYEKIADNMSIDISTVKRNQRRLLLMLNKKCG